MQDKLIEKSTKTRHCPKCNGSDVILTYRYWNNDLNCRCRTCDYEWSEKPSDAVRAHDAGTDEGLPTDRRPCPNCGRSDGWHYALGHPPLPVGDCRKIVWMRDKDEMEWWGVRAYNHAEGYWQSNSREESSTVLFWMETPHSPHYPPASHAASTAPDAGENAEHYVAHHVGVWESVPGMRERREFEPPSAPTMRGRSAQRSLTPRTSTEPPSR